MIGAPFVLGVVAVELVAVVVVVCIGCSALHRGVEGKSFLTFYNGVFLISLAAHNVSPSFKSYKLKKRV